ncbi:MAG TPA: PIN domain-containing protein [Luteolibacter sp.]|nr:PIN domain-containing protein [Luteolibacter sp.]
MNEPGRVLVDTNVWIDFLRKPLPELRELLKRRRVICHPCVIGEVLVGSPPNRAMIRQFLLSLPSAVEADFVQVLRMIETRGLAGRGLQWNDVLLLAAAKLSAARLWTRDRRLAVAADEFGIGWVEGVVKLTDENR